MTDLSTFYSISAVEDWRAVFGEDMFFYHGDYTNTTDYVAAQRQVLQNFTSFLEPHGKILDAGCGWGAPLRFLSTHGFDAEGIAISTAQAEYCRASGLPVTHTDLDGCPLFHRYHAIISIEVLDHFAKRAQIFQHFRSHSERLAISISCVADDFAGPRSAFGETMPMCSVSELRRDIEAAGWKVVHWHNRRKASLPSIFHWREGLNRTFGQTPPPGYFTALRDQTTAFFKNPAGWARSFPLVDVVAV